MSFLKRQPKYTMEPCGVSHYRSLRSSITRSGRRKPFVKSQKNDAADAEARPMIVAVKKQ